MRIEIYIYGALLLFGLLYAILIRVLHSSDSTEGVTALLVAFGVGVTLIGAYGIEIATGNITTLGVLIGFACSGTPMIVGDIGSYIWRRHNGRRLISSILGR